MVITKVCIFILVSWIMIIIQGLRAKVAGLIFRTNLSNVLVCVCLMNPIICFHLLSKEDKCKHIYVICSSVVVLTVIMINPLSASVQFFLRLIVNVNEDEHQMTGWLCITMNYLYVFGSHVNFVSFWIKFPHFSQHQLMLTRKNVYDCWSEWAMHRSVQCLDLNNILVSGEILNLELDLQDILEEIKAVTDSQQ